MSSHEDSLNYTFLSCGNKKDSLLILLFLQVHSINSISEVRFTSKGCEVACLGTVTPLLAAVAILSV